MAHSLRAVIQYCSRKMLPVFIPIAELTKKARKLCKRRQMLIKLTDSEDFTLAVLGVQLVCSLSNLYLFSRQHMLRLVTQLCFFLLGCEMEEQRRCECLEHDEQL